MTSQAPVTVVEGPKGKAEVFEVAITGGSSEYEVRFQGKTDKYKSLGEAYIEAGQKAGTKT